MTATPSSLGLETRRKPAFRLPAGATDAHCHVFGPGNRFPYAPGRRYTPEDAPKESLAALHAFLGISRAAIVQASCHGADNAAMLDAIAWRPDAYRGVAIVDDSFGEAALRKLHEGGVRGVRFNFVKHLGGAPDMEVFRRVVDRLAVLDMGWHVVLHMDGPDVVALSKIFARLPITFVVDHMGRVEAEKGVEQPSVRALLELARIERCWIKVSGAERIAPPPFDAAVPIAAAIVAAVPDRVLWGTDFPHPNPIHPCDESDLVDLVVRFAPTAELQYKLLVANPAKLYGFAG